MPLKRFTHSETTQLIINIPPRHPQSIYASITLPAFLLGRRGPEDLVDVVRNSSVPKLRHSLSL